MNAKTRVGALDLLRTIAIAMVVLAHTVLSYGAPASIAPLQFGGTGVDLFFVLSGWLLGNQLFKEHENRGHIDVRRFWFRRWMRTLPAYYVVLNLSVLQRYLNDSTLKFPFEYYIFIQNYFTPLPFYTVSWSLAVEEQFYLIIAPLIAIVGGLRGSKLAPILLVVLLLPAYFRHMDLYNSLYESHVRLDGCILGVGLSLVRNKCKGVWNFLTKHAPHVALLSLITYIFYFVARWFPHWEINDPDKLLLAVIFGSWVVLANKSTQWGLRLYVPGSAYIATRSYSIYLLHVEALAIVERTAPNAHFIIYFILAIALTLLFAEALYRFVEIPFMALREKFDCSKKSVTIKD